MGKLFGVLFIALVVIVAAVIIFTTPRAEGPVYNGKHLSEWARHLPAMSYDVPGIQWAPLTGNNTETAAELAAEDAVRQIGTNAIPFFMDEMRSHRADPHEPFAQAWTKFQMWFYTKVMTNPGKVQSLQFSTNNRMRRGRAEQDHWSGAVGLHTLGPMAKPVIPELAVFLNAGNGGNICGDAAYALGAMGDDGFPPLVQALTNKSDWVAMCGMWGLGQTPTNSAAAVPQIIAILQNMNPNVHMPAAWALGQIRTNPELEAPALAASLGDTASNARWNIEESLKKYGITSVTSQAFREYLNSPELAVRMAATNGLRALYPDDAAKLGIK